MENYFSFYQLFVDLVNDLRKKTGTTVSQLCADSHVSTRTFAKLSRKTPVKFECCYRLAAGSCKSATKNEFLEFWMHLGEEFYDKFSE